MFRGLRLRLTLLYLLVALALVGFVGGGTYVLLNAYFQSTADLALHRKMAQEIAALGLSVPPELVLASQQWAASYQRRPAPTRSGAAEHHADDERAQDRAERSGPAEGGEEPYDLDLAAIFVLPLSADGRVLTRSGAGAALFTPDREALTAALTRGSDLRTTSLQDGTQIRLLTYRLPSADGLVAIQLGRLLSDQERVLARLLTILLGLGGVSALLLGGGSWWVAGRSLRPAQQAWEQQQGFIANASHELRTPLTLMRASAEVALRGSTSDDQRELLGDVIAETDHMSTLVDDLLLLSRLDAGRLTLASEEIALADLLGDVQRQVGRLAEARGVGLRVEQAAGVVRGDATRLRQVLLIILDNALRHTSSGGTIRIETATHGRQVALSVADDGAGIPPQHLPHVFERFYRADSARSDEHGGTGLGLAIARALVEAQHGQIAISSQPGTGTRVTLTLPVAHG